MTSDAGTADQGRRSVPGIAPLPEWVPPAATLAEVLAGAASGLGAALARPLLAGRAFAVIRPVRPRAEHGWATQGDSGWFGPESVAWKVHADACLFVAGMTAFALQALHPLALAGVADHSAFATDFLGRVQRTGTFVQGVVFGTAAEAEARCAEVRRLHERVVGVAPDGRPYRADDPELLTWVHLGEYAAIAAAYRRFGLLPLRRVELDAYVAEVARVGEAMEVPDPPRSWADLDAGLQAYRPQLAVGEQAMAAVSFLREPPGLPTALRPAWRLLWAGAVACLPPFAGRLLRLPQPGWAELVACRSLIRAIGVLIGDPPALAAARSRVAGA